jgi:hypothetical protein
VDFPLLQRIALPITVGSVRYPGIKLHDARIIRLLEVLLHGGNTVGGWAAKEIHQTILTAFQLSANSYRLNQLRYDLRKLKGHALLERDGFRYAYWQRRAGCTPVPLLPQATLRPSGQQSLSSPAESQHRPDSKLVIFSCRMANRSPLKGRTEYPGPFTQSRAPEDSNARL